MIDLNPTIEEVCKSGRELNITVNGNTFVLCRVAGHVVATANGERHYMRGLNDREIKTVLEEYQPGAWSNDDQP